MTTLGTLTTRALVQARGSSQYLYEEKETQLLGIANNALKTIHHALKAVRSIMVYAIQTITTEADTGEYAPSSSFDEILKIDIADSNGTIYPITIVSEDTKTLFDTTNVTAMPGYAYLTEDGKVGFLDIPDAAYTVYVYYFPPLTELTALTGTGSTVPWKDIWNNVIQKMILNELLEIKEGGSQRRNIEQSVEWAQAMNATLALGTWRRISSDEMFSSYEEAW